MAVLRSTLQARVRPARDEPGCSNTADYWTRILSRDFPTDVVVGNLAAPASAAPCAEQRLVIVGRSLGTEGREARRSVVCGREEERADRRRVDKV